MRSTRRSNSATIPNCAATCAALASVSPTPARCQIRAQPSLCGCCQGRHAVRRPVGPFDTILPGPQQSQDGTRQVTRCNLPPQKLGLSAVVSRQKHLISAAGHKVAEEIREGGGVNRVIVLERVVQDQSPPARPWISDAGSTQHADGQGCHLAFAVHQPWIYRSDLGGTSPSFVALCSTRRFRTCSSIPTRGSPIIARLIVFMSVSRGCI